LEEKISAIKFKEFKQFLIARLCLVLGTQMQAVIVGWQIYEITKDPLSLGLIGLAEAIPSISVSLYAGFIVDRNSRKKIIMSSVTVLLICSILLLIIAADINSFILGNKLFLIYAVIFLSGIARGFISPANFAFLSQLVPKEALPNAVSWSSSNWQFGAVAGPAIGGLIYGFFGVIAAYTIDVAFMIIGLIFFAVIPKKPVPDFKKEEGIVSSIKEGLKFVFKNKLILPAISLDMLAVLFGGATAILPIFAGEILNVGAQGLGILRAAPAVGAVIMGLIMTRVSLVHNAGRNLFITVFMFGVCMLIFGLSKSFYLSIVALLFSGVFDQISVVIRGSVIQLFTPDNMKGRVSSVDHIFIGSSNEIGAFESGVMAKLMGTVTSVIFNSCMTLGVVTIIASVSKKLRKLKL